MSSDQFLDQSWVHLVFQGRRLLPKYPTLVFTFFRHWTALRH